MPKSAFSAIEQSVSAFLGGARVLLVELEGGEPTPEAESQREIVARLEIDGIAYLFRARRRALAFTATEKAFIDKARTMLV